jgi:formylglycine-generating enzyme
MRKIKILAVVMCVMAVANTASADTIRGINVDFVTIGNAGNAADTNGCGWYGYPSASGAVGYNYRIGTKEITANQWQTINNAAGIGGSGYWSGNQPAAFISWYDAARFCNYLTSGDKSLGAYQLGTDGSITVDRASAISAYGTIYVLPTEDEWYKAAYFKHDGSGYSLYANGTNIAPSTSDTCYSIYSSPWDVNSGTQEQNGTFDMMGNVWEWDETKPYDDHPWRIVRGGGFESTDPVWDLSSYRLDATELDNVNNSLGFRIASVPEPATILLLTLGGIILRKSRR